MKRLIAFALIIALGACNQSRAGQQPEAARNAKVATVAATTTHIGPADWDWSTAQDEFSSNAGFARSKGICSQLIRREPPAADAPDDSTAASLEGCSSETLYYGIGMAAEPVKARQCAFLEIAQKRDDAPFSGRTMLMIIYANGVGAARDLDVATHLACGLEGAAMESDGRVTHLAELKAKGWAGHDFSYCDDITSGLAGGYCAGHEADIAGAKRDAAFAALMRGWSPADRSAFAALKKAHAVFAQAHSEGEIDLSGTLRGAFAVEADERLNDELFAMIKTLEAGRAPTASADQLKSADASLNAAYHAFLSSDQVGGDLAGSITREGVRDAQRAWLRYRDAFLAFAAVRYPKVTRESIATWVTRNRTKMWTEN